MILTLAIALATQQAPTLSCPVMGGPASKDSVVTEYNGVAFSYCCGGCDTKFKENPKEYIAKAAKDGKTIGVSYFDPVSMKPIDMKKAEGGFSDYKGIRYYFASTDEKATFDKTPAKYGSLPKKEALFCPVSKEAVKSYDKAGGYADYEGTRYYFCCPMCSGQFVKDPAKFAANSKGHIADPATMDQKKSD
ncbi:MAG: hypothetical protein JST51_16795 [Armatimonadetes bacterium]|nr:hypothetical protein [Armatimonadota bacterium]